MANHQSDVRADGGSARHQRPSISIQVPDETLKRISEGIKSIRPIREETLEKASRILQRVDTPPSPATRFPPPSPSQLGK